MTPKPVKTNVMRMLGQAGIPFETREYEVDESDLTGVHVATQLGLDLKQVFKTLVAHGDRTGYLICCIPVALTVDLKLLAVISGNKRVELIPVKDLLAVTGYIRGGCSPIGMKKRFPAFVDRSAADLQHIAVSAGVRGCQIILTPADLIRMTQAVLCQVTQPSQNGEPDDQ